ncbi:hypothetical protein, partial [Ruminococcus bicirculans (ex Wegman et al. 2014)]|uniref:hypothetical protein n=1 Tax=Ruminococcus bicirculans (ex Wegman et al. 2014) TaxID=1160721 RepID=UPI00242C5106
TKKDCCLAFWQDRSLFSWELFLQPLFCIKKIILKTHKPCRGRAPIFLHIKSPAEAELFFFTGYISLF